MPNPHKGETSVTLGDGRTLTLRRDFNALAEAEEELGIRMDEIARRLEQGGPVMKITRALFWGALRAHHPEITVVEAGEMLESDGERIGEAMEKAVSASAALEKAEAGPANPPKPRRGTGRTSSRRG